MKKILTILCLLQLFCNPALAHDGHGVWDFAGIWHYLLEWEHLIWLVLPILLLVSRIYRVKKCKHKR